MAKDFPARTAPATTTGALLRALAPLILVQFACWTGMFLMWIGAYPVITLAIVPAAPGDPAALRRPLLAATGPAPPPERPKLWGGEWLSPARASSGL